MDNPFNYKVAAVAVQKYPNGKLWSYVVKLGGGNNLIDQVRGLDTVHLCASYKAAEALSKEWNEAFKRNGTCAY